MSFQYDQYLARHRANVKRGFDWLSENLPGLMTNVCLYALIDRVMKCIEHCATARAYGRFREAGTMIKMDSVAAGIAKSKEEKDNVEKGLN